MCSQIMFQFTVTEILVSVLLIILIGIIIHYKRAFKYWKNKNVPYTVQPRIPFGSLQNPLSNKIYIGTRMKIGYDLLKSRGCKHGGGFFFTTPKYIVIDPEYIKNILQRHFDHFTERGFYYNEKNDPLSANLFALGGKKWRILRSKLSPAFTSGKLKMMFDILVKCGHQMQEAIENSCKKQQAINAKDISECFTIDVIGSCAFGLECNCFKNPEAEFRKQGRRAFFMTPLRIMKIIFAFSHPKFARWLGIRLFDQNSTDFFVNVVKETVTFRKTNNVVRKDILQLLLELRNEQEENHCLSIEELTAQVFIFFAAGFETSSTTLAFCLYELASNAEIQDKVRDEINQIMVNHEEKITYEIIKDMKYMNQVVEETLRKYPPVSFITRVCVKDYQVPGTESIIEKGMETVISILGLHHDPDYYPEPEKFDPERFSEENKQKRRPFTYIPFGEGPRICIGLRFGLMQIKVAMTVLLTHYKFTLNEKTEVPIQMEPNSFTLIPKTGIFLNIEKII